MIQIKLSRNLLDDLVKEHAKSVITYIDKNIFTNAEKKYFTDKKLNEILTASPDTLEHYIVSGKPPMSLNLEVMKKAFVGQDISGQKISPTCGYHKFSNKKTKTYNAYSLAKSLKINVCPYCNRNYTFTIQSKNGGTRPQFDHFYDKGKYPFLALSFYNLIPSCHTCNASFKGQKKFSTQTHLHPYKDDFNSIAKFTFTPLDVSVYQNIASIDYKKLELKFDKSSLHVSDDIYEKAKGNIRDFGLQELYDEHKDIVLELIQKAEMYHESYIDELMQNYEGTLFKNKEDLLRLIFGGYISDEELSKRPLSKLTKDILEQLEII